jgi:hypothetical protein
VDQLLTLPMIAVGIFWAVFQFKQGAVLKG